MTPAILQRLLAAPELIVVDLTDDALEALHLALVVEHPLLDDDFSATEDPPVQRRARVALQCARRLRRALDAYRRAVVHVLREPPSDEWPF